MIRFGTDGWRAVISEEFTFDNVRKVSQAIADYYSSQSPNDPRPFVVGYDTRFLSDAYAKLVSEVLAGNGFEVILSDHSVPTPAVSVCIAKRQLRAGIMVTASHNPPQYNGIKIKDESGGPAPNEVTQQIEQLIGMNSIKSISIESAKTEKKIHLLDLSKEHIKAIHSYIDLKALKKKRFRVLVDAMHGASDSLIEKVLAGTPIRVTTIRSEINPSFGGNGPEPILKNLGEMTFRMKEGAFDLGIVNDGDADRIGAMRPDGRLITASEIMALLALHFIEGRCWRGSLVKTVSCSFLLDRIAEKYGLEIYETPIGFKNISKIMREQNVLIGGEESGGIGVKNYIPERDGVLLGLLLLEMMAYRNAGIIQIMDVMEKEYGRFYYLREDIPFPSDESKEFLENQKEKTPKDLLGRKIVQVKDQNGIKWICEDGSWLLLRFSGTESLLRIYAEADALKRTKDLIQYGRQLAHS